MYTSSINPVDYSLFTNLSRHFRNTNHETLEITFWRNTGNHFLAEGHFFGITPVTTSATYVGYVRNDPTQAINSGLAHWEGGARFKYLAPPLLHVIAEIETKRAKTKWERRWIRQHSVRSATSRPWTRSL